MVLDLAAMVAGANSATVSDAARDLWSEHGWDPQYVARPLKRAITSLLSNVLAKKLLAGEFASGDTIAIDVRDGELTLEPAVLN